MTKFCLTFTVCLFLAGCGTSAEPTYYTLDPVQGAVAADLKTLIKIERPDIPDYLDRPQFIRQDGAFTLSIDETAYWIEPLDKMMARILEADLQQRLPHSLILTEDADTPRDIPFSIDLTIQKFNALMSTSVGLEGELTLNDTHAGTKDFIPVAITSQSSGSASGIAAGLSEVLGELADNIVGNLKVKQVSP